MAITTTCANGHVLKVKDEFAGKSGLCPHCRGRVFVPMPVHANDKSRISDDEILGVLGKPGAKPQPRPAHDEHVLGGHAGGAKEESAIDLGRSSILLKKQKICPTCKNAASVAFSNCPTCGTLLPDVKK